MSCSRASMSPSLVRRSSSMVSPSFLRTFSLDVLTPHDLYLSLHGRCLPLTD